MDAIFCPNCGLRQPAEHRFCVACGCELPLHLLNERQPKASRFFAGTPVAPDDPAGGYLRVSSYREDRVVESPEGRVTIPGHHVRFSIWVEGSARCVLSLPESEARELARFLSAEVGAAVR